MRDIIVTFFMFAFCNGFSQQVNKISEKEFMVLREKTENIIYQYPDSADIYCDKLLNFAKKLNSEQIYANALSTLAFIKSISFSSDEVLMQNRKSFLINKKLKNNKEIANNYFLFSKYYQMKSNNVLGTKFLLMSLEISEKENLYVLTQKNYRNLSRINVEEENFNNSMIYANKAIEIEKKSPNNVQKALNTFTLADCYQIMGGKVNLAKSKYIEAYNLFPQKDYDFSRAWMLSSSSFMYIDEDYNKAVEMQLKAQETFDQVAPSSLLSMSNLSYIARNYYFAAKNDSLIKKIKSSEIPNSRIRLLKESETIFKRCIILAKKYSNILAQIYFYKNISELQSYQINYKDAYLNLTLSKKLNDSIYSQENKNAIAKLESEKEVLKLKTANEKKSTLNKILIGSSIGLLLIGFLGYRNFRNKRKLQNLKISELEKDKQLLAIDTMLKTQEEERSRIAKDLHDGLGGLLSGTKLSFTNMKENLLLTPENAILFEKSIGMLDTTIADLRKVAHNLMPEALVKFGLNDALNDFCSSIQLASNIKVDYQKIGLDRKIGNTAETFIYRIIQELVNNAVKHADAKEILVQVAFTNNKIIVTVEDNGKGYDKNLASTGDGLDNIAYRVKYLSGTIDTVTSPNNGTSVNIELNV